MTIAREGIPFVGLAVGVTFALGVGATWMTPSPLWGVTPGLLLTGFVAFFFRVPAVDLPESAASVLVAPASGRILSITDHEESAVGGPCRRVTIFLSVFDVHVQRAPCAAEVVGHEYRGGGYAVAWHPKASEQNERAHLVFEREDGGRFLVRQVAGLIARRIVTDPRPGARVAQGERIGLIRFGSRVDLEIPRDWTITCSPGDRVAVGSTPVCRPPGDGEGSP